MVGHWWSPPEGGISQWVLTCQETDEGKSSCLGSQQRKRRASDFVSCTFLDICGHSGCRFCLLPSRDDQLIQICYLAELLLPGSSQRSKSTWNHHYSLFSMLSYGSSSTRCLTHYIFSNHACAVQLSSSPPATPLFSVPSSVPGFSAHSRWAVLWHVGQIRRQYWRWQQFTCGPSGFILLPWFFKAFGRFRSSQAVSVYFEDREKFVFSGKKSSHGIFRSDLWVQISTYSLFLGSMLIQL